MSWVNGFLSVVFVSLISLLGATVVAVWRNISKVQLLYLVSFSVGGLLGGAFLHLLPESIEMMESRTEIGIFVIIGIFSSFIIEIFLKWRHCHIPTTEDHPHTFAYMNLIGDGIHNFIDGMVIGVAYMTSTQIGVATTLAICLHEIPQEIGDFSVLVYAGYNVKKALFYNLLSALTAFIGLIIAFTLESYVSDVMKYLIPFAAGNFIYIAGSDLVPELQGEKNLSHSLIQLIMMVLGVLILYGLKFIE